VSGGSCGAGCYAAFPSSGDCCLLDIPHLLVGAEDDIFICVVTAFLPKRSPDLAQFPDADGRMGCIAVRNREVLLQFGIEEMDDADVARIAPHHKPATMAVLLFRVDPRPQDIVEVGDVVHHDAVDGHRPLFERHEIEAKPFLGGADLRQSRPSDSLFVYADRRAAVESGVWSLMIDLDDVAREPQFQFADRQSRALFRVVALALPRICKRRTGSVWTSSANVPIRRSMWPP